jgi:hypothetical protein
MQARWVADVFSGRAPPLPHADQRRHAAKQAASAQQREFPCNAARMPHLVDPYDYCNDRRGKWSPNCSPVDALSRTMGPTAQVPYARILRSGDWGLLECLLFDSWSPFAYRLNDRCPQKRQLARDVIFRYHRHRTCRRIRQRVYFYISVLLILFGLAVVATVTFFRRHDRRPPI